MATILAPPEGFDPPEWDFKKDREANMKAEADYIERLATWLRSTRQGELVGKVVRFPAADSYAQYMVASEKPLHLVHLPIGDAWQIPAAHARGLRLSDIRALLARKAILRT